MKPAAVESAFDVAQWFLDSALDDSEYLQPGKLHRLLFLAQAYYAVAFGGELLMPAVFVAHETGPVEPNIFRAFEHSRLPLETRRVTDDDALHLLDSIWRRFGAHSGAYLSRILKSHEPWIKARDRGKGAPILLEEMRAFYALPPESRKKTEVHAAPSPDAVVRPRYMRSQHGRAVPVKKWEPPAKKKSGA